MQTFLADNGLADLINQHAIQPGAVVVQAVAGPERQPPRLLE